MMLTLPGKLRYMPEHLTNLKVILHEVLTHLISEFFYYMSKNNSLWIPSEDRILNSNIKKYYDFLNKEFNLSFRNYSELHTWSVTDIEKFWESIWKYSGIIHSTSYHTILNERSMPGANWFEGSKLNFAENLLRFRDDRVAIISSREDKPDYKITYKKLYELVVVCSTGLKELGIKGETGSLDSSRTYRKQ